MYCAKPCFCTAQVVNPKVTGQITSQGCVHEKMIWVLTFGSTSILTSKTMLSELHQVASLQVIDLRWVYVYVYIHMYVCACVYFCMCVWSSFTDRILWECFFIIPTTAEKHNRNRGKSKEQSWQHLQFPSWILSPSRVATLNIINCKWNLWLTEEAASYDDKSFLCSYPHSSKYYPQLNHICDPCSFPLIITERSTLLDIIIIKIVLDHE